MFFNRKSKLNEDRLNSYTNYVLSIIDGHSMMKYTDLQKINGINKVHKILLSSVQQKIFEAVSDSTHPIDSYPERYFFDNWSVPDCNYCHTNYRKRTIATLENPITVYLNTDPVLSFPWDKDRLSTLQYIGYRTNKPFENRPLNHKMTFFYPINIFLVYNGMHSIFAGIYDRSNYASANQIVNMSSFYQHYYFDGTHFRHYTCNKIIDTPKYVELGILYELGRIYLNKNVDFHTYYKII